MRAPISSPARTAARLLLPLLTLAMVGVVPATTAHSLASTGAQAADAYEQAAVATTNKRRTQHDLRTLHTDSCLGRFAHRQATRMAAQRRIFHQDLAPVLNRCGLRRVGENVAVGYRSGTSAVNDGWMRSPGHRHNILTRPFRVVAVGAAHDASGRWYTAQVLGSH